MATKPKRLSAKPWPQFRSSEHCGEKYTTLDAGRAEVMLEMLVLPDILQGNEKTAFIKALHDASHGNPKAFIALLAAVQKWSYLSSSTNISQLEALWAAAKLRPPKPNAMALLRRVCKRQRIMSPSMLEAFFDDASFDFSAYLNWHSRAG